MQKHNEIMGLLPPQLAGGWRPSKLPYEDHWMSKTETRVQLLQALASFLHDHIQGVRRGFKG
jgi:hypothetical protein